MLWLTSCIECCDLSSQFHIYCSDAAKRINLYSIVVKCMSQFLHLVALCPEKLSDAQKGVLYMYLRDRI